MIYVTLCFRLHVSRGFSLISFTVYYVFRLNVHDQQGRSKFLPRTGREGPDGARSISTFSLTSALDLWGGGLTLRPARFPPGKEARYPLYRRLDGPQGRSGRMRELPPPTGIR